MSDARIAIADPLPEYDEIWIVCRCGKKIGGTIIRGKGFEFHCLHCSQPWSGLLIDDTFKQFLRPRPGVGFKWYTWAWWWIKRWLT